MSMEKKRLFYIMTITLTNKGVTSISMMRTLQDKTSIASYKKNTKQINYKQTARRNTVTENCQKLCAYHSAIQKLLGEH